MSIRTYLMIKCAGDYVPDEAVEYRPTVRDRLDYLDQIEKNVKGFERTLNDPTTYPGYGYTLEDLGPYGRTNFEEHTPYIDRQHYVQMPYLPGEEAEGGFGGRKFYKKDKADYMDGFNQYDTDRMPDTYTTWADDLPVDERTVRPPWYKPWAKSTTIIEPRVSDDGINQQANEMRGTLQSLKSFYKEHPDQLFNGGWVESEGKDPGTIPREYAEHRQRMKEDKETGRELRRKARDILNSGKFPF